jgi:pantoate--beta-alanine ligase
MRIVRSVAAMQRMAREWKRRGTRVALVPTMGFLHGGHLSLVARARRSAGKKGVVALSIYVNPAQFAAAEDLARYPRDPSGDQAKCRAAGVDVLFAPSDREMYGRGEVPAHSVYVVEEELSRLMEGVSRPGHFRGVTTVVAKLFNIVMPEYAVFGAKDFQQAAVVKKMVCDLNFQVKIVVAKTCREADGLALSSRNKYLSPAERLQATALYRSLSLARSMIKAGPVPAAELKRAMAALVGAEPSARLDYAEVFDSKTLQPLATAHRGARVALAVFIGKTRLIDNALL